MTLPRGWAKATLGSICELVNGRAFKPGEWSDAGLPIIRIQNLNRHNAPFNHFSGHVEQRYTVRDGDLLFAWSGTPGTSFGAHVWRGPKAVLNQHIFNVRVDSQQIDREFLKAAINQTLEEQIAKAHGGVGLRHVTRGAFEATELVLPPLNEQKRIVERLRFIAERVGSVRLHVRNATSALEGARSALLQSAFDLTLLPEERRPHKPFVALGDVASDLMYGTSEKSAASGKVPVLRMGNIQQGDLDWSDLVFTSDDDEIRRYALKPGDVLFNRTNSPDLVGKTALYRGERPAIFAGYLIRIRCSKDLIPEYITYCLNSPAGRSYCRAVKSDGVSQSNINATKLAAFRLPLPTLDEQQEIVTRVQSGLARLKAIVELSKSTDNFVALVDRRLVSQAMSGNLGTNDPADEPAVAQIARLVTAKDALKVGPKERSPASRVEGMMDVSQILSNAGDWVPAQEVAKLYGIVAGTPTEKIEHFYAELRELDSAGRLLSLAIVDEDGRKVGEKIRLRALV